MRPILSIRTYITVMIVATVLPVLIFSGLLVNRAATNEQELMARAMREAALAAASDLNREIGGLMSLALTIADARMLRIGDLPAFYKRWSQVVEREGLAAIVYDTTGQQLVNTARPFGTVLPAEPAMVRQVVETGETQISDLTRAEDGTMVVSIAMPVRRGGQTTYVLSLRITRAIGTVMDQQILVPGQYAVLIDRAGKIVYRTHEPERFIGAQAPTDTPLAFQGKDEGAFLTHALDGVPIYVAFSRVKQTGWVMAVAMPSQLLFAPATHSLNRLLALGGGTLLLVVVVAWVIGRGVANSVGGLSRLATALGSGTQDEVPEVTHIREVNAVAAAMREASVTLRHQTEQREQVSDALRAEAEGRQRAEQQLAQSQKMEAVGQLTGGMAHDFNNLLAIIVGSLDLLRQRWADDPKGIELAEEAMKAALTGAALTRQLLAFARRQPLRPERCDINEVIGVFIRLLSRTLGEDIEIDLRLAGDLWPVLIDRVQLEAAITNLATNARHAMPEGGRLTIETVNRILDDGYAATHPEASPGEYVLIEVRDTGTGMPPEVLDRIFEPFFTTKEPGQGTGLGLSMVFGFLKQSGGHITAYSEPGEGTAFRLYLPRLRGAGDTEPPEDVSLPSPGRGQGEVVLAVEDNAGLRQVLVHQLIDAGYEVLEAENGQAALGLIERGAKIDLLLTDIVMPGGMNGHELARLAGLLRPGIRILLTSGFSDMANGGAAVPPDVRILRKPYRQDELLRVLHDALHEPGAGS